MLYLDKGGLGNGGTERIFKTALVLERRAGHQGCNGNQTLWKINSFKAVPVKIAGRGNCPGADDLY